MRLAYENGLTYVVEDLEDKRETTAAQAALALEGVRSRFMFGGSGRLELELVRPERLSKAFSGCPDELGAVDDLRYLGLGAVATHVFFLEHLLEGHVLAYAADDVLEDVLLALRERGGSRAAEEPLPKRPTLAHVDSLAPSSCFSTTRHHSNRATSSR